MRMFTESFLKLCSSIMSYSIRIKLFWLGCMLSDLSMIDVRNDSRFDSRIYLSAVCLNKIICSFLMLARTFSVFVLRSSMWDSLNGTGVEVL